MHYSIIIPVYNEKNNILKLISKIQQCLKSIKFEILVIDDDSNDGTKELFKKIKLKKNVKFIIRKDKPRDLTQSVFLGISNSKYENLIIMDGDLQHNPKYLPKICKIFNKKKIDLLICVRNFKNRSGLSILRFFSSVFLIKLINLILGYKSSDPMSGFFVFQKKNFNKRKLYPYGFKILLSLIYSSNRNIIINEFQIKFNKRQNNKSKMNLKVLYHIVCSITYHLFKYKF